MSKSSEIYSRAFGRIHYLKHIFDTLVIKYLSRLAVRHLESRGYPVAMFAFDGIATTISVKGVYEREQLDTVFGWLNSEHLIRGSAIDIGANIGNHSLYFSRFYSSVFSFEPNPRTFRLLEINAALVDNVRPFNFGLSDRAASLPMRSSPENMGGSRIITESLQDSDCITVEVKPLDSIRHEIQAPIGLIKIDVEGHEFSALSGARQIIRENRPIILFEQSESDFENGSSKVIELLRSLGYRSFAIVLPSPLAPPWLPRILRPALTLIARCIAGFRFKIASSSNIAPAFYSFIIAIPDRA